MGGDHELLWTPPSDRAAASRMADFATWVGERCDVDLAEYSALHRLSISDLGRFWADISEYFGVFSDVDPSTVLPRSGMPGARWFPDRQVNFAQHVLAALPDDNPALLATNEAGERRLISGAALRGDVAAFAATLREIGVMPGDRVAGVVANTEHAVIAMLGTVAVGAIWCGCSPDFGAPAVIERLGQVTPTVLVAIDGYRYAGRVYRRRPDLETIRAALPSARAAIWIDNVDAGVVPDGWIGWHDAVAGSAAAEFAALPFDHPLWILFSSGTTGAPKGIVHSHGGVLLEQLKAIALHMDVGPGDRFFWYTSTAWMMWNVVVSALLTGATSVLYDGSPTHPDLDALWTMAENCGVTYFGTSAGHLAASARAGLTPGARHDLSSVRSIGSTGSPLAADTARWVYRSVGADVHLASASGGTDVVSGFLGGAPLLPVYAGEISGPLLGVAVDAWDSQGNPVRGYEGELVVTAPMPSMPIRFWNDPDGTRYHEAYFDTYPGVWRHGDWLEITDRGTAILSGRSDSTLNRGGVRMGTADVYAVLDTLPQIIDSVLLGVELGDRYWMPLFVVPAPGVDLDDSLRDDICSHISESVSPRHVPDEVIAAPAVPRTRTGKRLEVPLKRIFQGVSVDRALNSAAVADPDALTFFIDMARTQTAADISTAAKG